MKYPGEKTHQGFPTEDLDFDEDATVVSAKDLIDIYLEDADDHRVEVDAVVNIMGLHPNDLIHWTSDEVPAELTWTGSAREAEDFGVLEVYKTNQYSATLEVGEPWEREAGPTMTVQDDVGCDRLLRDWLRGDVRRVRAETKFYDADTDEEIEA